ncbi:MAG: nucleotidyltransferase domain-containing protein [Rhodospirillales bacterium]
MPLTLNVDPPHVAAIKRHARKTGKSASRLVTQFIDGLTTETPPPSLGVVIQRLRANRDDLTDKGLLNVAVFGSVARGEEAPGSDIDLMVKVAEDMSAFRLAGLQSDLREILGAPVEVVTLSEFNEGFDRSVQHEVVIAY